MDYVAAKWKTIVNWQHFSSLLKGFVGGGGGRSCHEVRVKCETQVIVLDGDKQEADTVRGF